MSNHEVISDVLIIEANGKNPMCFIVDNLPKHFLYARTKKLMPKEEYSSQLVPAFVVDENGKKVPTEEMEDTLQPGIEKSQSGDGAFLFFPQYTEARDRLRQIDEYIAVHITDPAMRRRVHYAQQPGLMSSHPLHRGAIPRVVLPAPSPKTVPPVSGTEASADFDAEKVRRAEILAKARAAKAAKMSAIRAEVAEPDVETPEA